MILVFNDAFMVLLMVSFPIKILRKTGYCSSSGVPKVTGGSSQILSTTRSSGTVVRHNNLNLGVLITIYQNLSQISVILPVLRYHTKFR